MAHILIAEDDDLLRDALSAQLSQAGHTVACAAHGLQARELLENTRFDGVIWIWACPSLTAWRCCNGYASACWPCRC